MSDTINILVAGSTDSKGVFSGAAAIPVEISIEKLRAGFSTLVAKLRAATRDLAMEADGLTLKEIECGIEVSAEGGVNLIGCAKLGATASIKLTFVRHQ